MEANKNYANDGMQQSHPGDINPNDHSHTEPAKTIHHQERLEINQSGLGRDQGQTPADEHIEHFSQIDDETRSSKSMEQTIAKEFDTDDFRRVDERDNNDSSEDWDAEKSRTGRNK